MIRVRLVFAALLGPLLHPAQEQLPAWGNAFLQDEVAVIRITIDPDTLELLLDPVSWGNSHEFPATFIYQSSAVTDTLENIGFRLRGNTSLNAAKQSFKVAFDAFGESQWQGLEKLNLLGQHNDPSLLRSKLCWDSMRYLGLPGSRTSFVRLFINEEFRGIYLNTEHIDEEFTQLHFGDGTGNLWKCTYPADLDYLGTNPDLYKLEMWGNRIYALETNQEIDDYSDLAAFIAVLNNTPIASLPCALEEVFNVHDYLKYLAIDVLTGNWDGHAYNKNNFYLAHNERTGRIEYIPYDLDNTLGIDWLGMDWTERNIYDWSPSGQDRPLYERLMQVPAYRDLFSSYIESFIAEWFNSEGIIAHAEELQALLTPFIFGDTYYPLDYGFTTDDFLNSIDAAWGGQVDHGIAPFVEARSASALDQLESVDPVPVVHQQQVTATGTALLVSAWTNSIAGEPTAWVRVSGSDAWTPYVMISGLATTWDEQAWTAAIGDADPLASYEYTVTTNGAEPGDDPCFSGLVHLGDSPIQLVINEVMSSNTSGPMDEGGVAEDWIELFNAGTSDVYLGNKFITDDPEDWNKWPLPDFTLDAGDWVLLWADNDPEEGVLHTNFRISADGESLAIYEVSTGAPWRMDSVTVPAIPVNTTWGRSTDGAASWILFETPTPDAANGVAGIAEGGSTHWRVWPNPVADELYSSQPLTGQLCDVSGRIVAVFESARTVPVQSLPPGIYFLRAGLHTEKIVVR